MSDFIFLPENTVAFTGKRPKKLCGYNSAKYQHFIQELTDYLKVFLNEHPFVNTFISGGAQGFDMLAFHAVENLKAQLIPVRNIIFVPFPNQPNLWLPTGCFSKAEWHDMCNKADMVHICSENPTNKDEAATALHNRNKQMINNAQYLIGLIDYTTALTGGTGSTIRYAQRTHKDIYLLRPTIMNDGLHIASTTKY